MEDKTAEDHGKVVVILANKQYQVKSQNPMVS